MGHVEGGVGLEGAARSRVLEVVLHGRCPLDIHTGMSCRLWDKKRLQFRERRIKLETELVVPSTGWYVKLFIRI